MATEHAEEHVHCNHWEPLPGGYEQCCTCNHVDFVDNPDADALRALLWQVADSPVAGSGPTHYAVALPSDLWHRIMDAAGYDEMGQ